MMRHPSPRAGGGASGGCAPPAPRGPPMAGSGAIHHHDDGGPVPGTNLTRDEAAERARLLDDGSYDVELDLPTGDKTFRTTTVVRITAGEPGAATPVDPLADGARAG